ncbi:MAG: beta-ketoacyl synthase N-terminal-like domain-containing protein [Planctomycetota bacterium]
MSQPKIAVTGIGINSAFGTGLDVNAKALQDGVRSVIRAPESWQTHRLRSQVCGDIRVDGLADLFDRKQNRFLCESALLAAASMVDAIKDSGLSDSDVQSPETGLIVGTGAGASINDVLFLCDRVRERGASKVGAYHVPVIMGSSLSANLGSIFKIHGHSYSITSACATSAHAIMLGMDTIRSGRQKRVFVGGAEDISPFSAGSFDGMRALTSDFNDAPERASRPLDKNRDGFVFSGGAGILLLENYEVAKARGAHIHGIIAGAAASCDGDQMVVPNGVGAEQAMRAALNDASVNAEQIDYVNLHATSTPAGDIVELDATLRVFNGNPPPFSSTKSMTGHALGAAGSQEAIFCILMMQQEFLAPNVNLDDPDDKVVGLPVVTETCEASPTTVLSNSFGFGGTNCSLVIQKY